MAVIEDFASLEAEVTNWLSRTGDVDFGIRFSTIVQILESEINTLIRIAGMEVEETFTILANADRVQMPAEFGGVRGQPYIVGNFGRQGVDLLPLSELLRFGRYGAGTGSLVYAMSNRNMLVRPLSSNDQTINVRYYKRVAPLEEGVNFLVQSDPDIYLNGCLARGYEYLGREKDGDDADETFRSLLDDLVESDVFQRWGGSPSYQRKTFSVNDRPQVQDVLRGAR